MGMSTHIQGFKAPGEKWKAMKAVYEACTRAGVELPNEVSEYFEYDAPDERGVEVKLDESKGCSEWSDDSRQGYEIDVRQLPADLTHIRFYNSW